VLEDIVRHLGACQAGGLSTRRRQSLRPKPGINMPTDRTYIFGPFQLHLERAALLEGDKPVRIGSRALEILTALVERAGEVVDSQELISRVWPETHVDESNLRVHLAAIRKALRDGQDQTRYILNVPGRGYRFVAPVLSVGPDQTHDNHRGNLPALLKRLVGRAEIIKEVIEDIPGHRFVTITGGGGIGKTSVALAIGHEVSAGYRDGAWFVDLTSLTDPTLVPSTLAAALGLPLLSEMHVPALIPFLQEKQMLIVLDNCEHVVGAAAELVEALLKAAPHVHFLTTSREPLRAEGEWIRRLPPLESPPESEVPLRSSDALAFPAAQLFAERAKAGFDSFELTDAEAPLLADLCRKLDGIPLAIELAAARPDVFGVAGLTAQIENSLALLTRGLRTAQPRHRTLRATLDWSYGLLPEGEQVILARLGVFRTAFSRGAAIAVVSDNQLAAETILDGLTNLAAKSMVVSNLTGGRVAYRLLDTTRAYATEKLGEGPPAAAVHRRHAEYFRERVKQLDAQSAPNERSKLEECRSLVDEIRAALRWAFSSSGDAALGLDLTAESSFVWYQLSLLDEYRLHAETALECIRGAPNAALEAELRLHVAIGPALYNTKGSVPEVAAAFARALEIAEQIEDIRGQLWALFGFWQYHHGLGLYAKSLELAEEFGARVKAATDPTSMFPRMKAVTHLYRGELAMARDNAEYALNHSPKRSRAGFGAYEYDQRVSARALLARILWLQGFPERALAEAQASVEEGIAINHSLSVCFAAALAACPVALWAGDLYMASRYIAFLDERATASVLPHWHGYSQVFRRALDGPGESSQEQNWNYRHREELSALGEGFASDELMARAKANEALWCSAEILRLEALRMLRKSDPDPLCQHD
jgi:predicted ATPase/DNA-binding winged helix-turn-helix (wHTH) protein